jgi:hypothetical protein
MVFLLLTKRTAEQADDDDLGKSSQDDLHSAPM